MLNRTNIASSVATGTFALSMSSTGYRVHQYLSILSIFNLSVHFAVDLIYSPESNHGVVESSDEPLYGVFIQKHIRYPVLVLEGKVHFRVELFMGSEKTLNKRR